MQTASTIPGQLVDSPPVDWTRRWRSVLRRVGIAARRLPLRARGIRKALYGETALEYYTRLSEWGGTLLEKQVDVVAASLGIRFDGAQYPVWLTLTGSYAVIDRVILTPWRVAVYINGIQHDLRPEVQRKDELAAFELKERGWMVTTIRWQDMSFDPIGSVRKALWMIH